MTQTTADWVADRAEQFGLGGSRGSVNGSSGVGAGDAIVYASARTTDSRIN